MNYDEYVRECQSAASLAESGERVAALDAFLRLAGSSLPDLDRAVMYVNAATLQHQLGDAEAALEHYDKAVAVEEKHNRFAVLELKAAFLAQLGRAKESLELYRGLARRPDATLSERARFEQNAATLAARL